MNAYVKHETSMCQHLQVYVKFTDFIDGYKKKYKIEKKTIRITYIFMKHSFFHDTIILDLYLQGLLEN
jgi:hypothetical protein